MSKKLILHIGAEKTATTAIQGCLSKNRQLLKELSIIYPETSFSKDAHFSLVAALHEIDHGKMLEFAPPGEYTYESEWKPLIDMFNDLKNDSTMILSAEHFSSRLKNGGLQRLSEIISEFDTDELEVVYYFRRQDLYFQSWYSTYIKAGGKKTIREIYPGLLRDRWFFDFEFVKSKWAEYFPKAKMSLIPFDYVKANGSVIEHFFSEFVYRDLSAFDFEIPKSESNASWSAAMIGLGRSVNKIYGNELKHRYQLLESINRNVFGSEGSKYIVPSSVSRKILAQYKEANYKLCESLEVDYEEVFKDLNYSEYDDPDEVEFGKDSLLDLLINSHVWKL